MLQTLSGFTITVMKKKVTLKMDFLNNFSTLENHSKTVTRSNTFLDPYNIFNIFIVCSFHMIFVIRVIVREFPCIGVIFFLTSGLEQFIVAFLLLLPHLSVGIIFLLLLASNRSAYSAYFFLPYCEIVLR
jgi:hypothetical protein